MKQKDGTPQIIIGIILVIIQLMCIISNIALKHISTSSQNMSFYVRGGSTVDLDVPLGEYDIYYASGSAWYGKDDLFGPTGSYHKCEDTFAFTLSGDTYDGWTLTLYPVANGNLDTEEINIDEFPK